MERKDHIYQGYENTTRKTFGQNEPQQNHPAPGQERHPPIQRGSGIQFTQEESDILLECNKEAFYKRGLPLGLLFGGIAQYGVFKGITRGGILTVFVSGFSGYLIGKTSYQPACRRKILERIPNSNLARMVKGLPVETDHSTDIVPESSTSDSKATISDDTYTNTNIDTSRPTYDLDSKRGPEQTDDRPVKRSMTYEELRHQNRVRQSDTPKPSFPSSKDPLYTPPSSSQDFESVSNTDRYPRQEPQFSQDDAQSESNGRKRPTFFADKPLPDSGRSKYKNQYGDEWDK